MIYVLQVNEAVDGLIDELHYLQDEVNNMDPIAVVPAEIQDQISDNRVRLFTFLFLHRVDFLYLKLHLTICCWITRASRLTYFK